MIDGPGNTQIIHDLEIARVGDSPILVDIAYLKTPSPTPRPAILIVHGGGWSGGSKSLNLNWAINGYFVYSVAYRLDGVAKWPAQIEDCKLALRWLRANAAKYNINPDKIGVTGHSAGGHLVCCLATMTDPKYDVGDFPGVSSAVQAVVDMAGPSDLTTFFKSQPGYTKGLFGQDGLDHPELVADASPVNHVKPGLPPFFVVHGDADKSVPISQAEEMVAALKKAGDSVQYVVDHNGGHSLGGLKTDAPTQPTHAELETMISAFFDKNLK